MKRFYLPALLLAIQVGAAAAEPGVSVPGFGPAERVAADGIGLVGPTEAQVGDEITIRLTGTPPLDLTLPLIDQLAWLMGENRMYCYVAGPGKPLAPLDVRGELVFSQNGATMQPLLRLACASPGEYRILCDWNSGQNQLAEHRIVVGGAAPGPDPPNPPLPPIVTDPIVCIIMESDDQAKGLEGARLNGHIAQVRAYLIATGVAWQMMDEDQEAARSERDLMVAQNVTSPALVIRDRSNPAVVTVLAFGADADETIAKLQKMGIK